MLDRHPSVSSRVRYSAELYGLQIVGAGTYLQGPATTHQMRLELKLQVRNRQSVLQQVCDGQTLWVHQRLDTQATLGRVDVAKLIDARRARAEEARIGAAANVQGQGRGGEGVTGLGLGGLPKLVRNLAGDFHFPAMQTAQLVNVPVYVLRGEWQPQVLARWLPDQQGNILAGKPVDLGHLPPQAPDEVLVYLGRDDLFPYRVEYRRSLTGKRPTKPGEATPIKSLLTVEFFEVQIGAPLDERAFVYQPGDTPVADLTDEYIRNLSAP